MMMTVNQEIAWGLCLGTVGSLLAATFVLKKIDVRKPSPSVVATSAEEGTHAA
jgi:UDP-GlcNAc:undecaprenyl-phosphate GlcNAc-1-phosphate transferase